MDRSKSVEVLYENLEGEKILSRLHFHYQPDVSHFLVVVVASRPQQLNKITCVFCLCMCPSRELVT